MPTQFYRLRQFLHFYWNAVTRYQLHSPFVFELANAVLGDDRWYYAFRDVEEVRERMLESDVKLEVLDFGAAPPGPPTGGRRTSPSISLSDPHEKGEAQPSPGPPTGGRGASPSTPFPDPEERSEASLPPVGGPGGAKRHATVRLVARQASSSHCQGQMLFRLANWASPKTMLELGTSLGIGAMYLASGMRSAKFISLEGCADFAQVARTNLEILGLNNTEVVTGEFGETLPGTLERLQNLDFVFFDGNHRPGPTLRYFETCLLFAHEKTVFVFDDAYWSPDMTEAWKQIQQHPRVTLTVDFFELSLAFVNPEFREKQHFKVVPVGWKPWKVF